MSRSSGKSEIFAYAFMLIRFSYSALIIVDSENFVNQVFCHVCVPAVFGLRYL